MKYRVEENKENPDKEVGVFLLSRTSTLAQVSTQRPIKCVQKFLFGGKTAGA